MNDINSLNVTSPVDDFFPQSPVECYKVRILGVFCVILFFVSLVFNSLLLWVFIRFKEMQSVLNVFMIALTCLNLFGTIFELPWIIVSNLACRWVFEQYGCIISSFLMYTVGCSSIYLMAFISIERFYVVYRPLSIKKITLKISVMIVIGCILHGMMWASFPLIGWSRYSLEGAMTSCSIEWRERSTNVTSYNITIFLVVFMLPAFTIVFTNCRLLTIIKNIGKFNVNQAQQVERRSKKQKMERNLTITMMLIVVEFLVAWTPYALVSMYSAFINENGVPPLVGTIPALFAKSSMLWTSVLYIFSSKKARQRLTEILKLKISATTDDHSRNKTLGVKNNNLNEEEELNV